MDENASFGSNMQSNRSKIPAPTSRNLQEISDSDNNARASTAMPPPNGARSKHKPQGLPESVAKRQTLIERAGEPLKTHQAAPPSSRHVNSSVHATSLAGPRNNSATWSASSRYPSSTSSRNTSNGSMNGSLTGMRPPSAHGYNRPQSAFGQSINRQLFGASSIARPASSLETYQEGRPSQERRKVLDTQGSLDDMEKGISSMVASMAAVEQRSTYKEFIELYKTRVNELEAKITENTATNSKLQNDLEEAKTKLYSITVALEDARRCHGLEVDDLKRKQRNEMEDLRDQQRRDEETSRRANQDDSDKARRQHMEELSDLERRLRTQVDEEVLRRQQEVQDISAQLSAQKQAAELDSGAKDQEARDMQKSLDSLNGKLELEQSLNESLRGRISESTAKIAELESSLEAVRAKVHFLESDSQAQSQAFADLNRQTQEAVESARQANDKLRAEETLRRKLHNQVQELKGNIRVFCRVRPPLDGDDPAKIAFPDAKEDSKELIVTGPEHKSATGNISAAKNSFSFDRVFSPECVNKDIFEEISQLVQSALDGYNVCIFCYGQTGSGKTFTMTSEDGMVPLAVHQIYDTARDLEEKGWTYKMEGSFVEVYNENLNDLLGKADDLDKKKHEIRHDNQTCKTTITDVTVLELESPGTVNSILRRASANRSVAATKANERSSRSHSVFILKLTGANSITGERSEGTLNLVDLAGSERLNHSGATGDRLKETQNINKSLSSLGDVISALGQGKDAGHIPYRNSKLTYLLQHSLGGNSKTLMFVMISPLQAHLNETLTSLKFATKVHNTHIGTAKKQTRVKD